MIGQTCCRVGAIFGPQKALGEGRMADSEVILGKDLSATANIWPGDDIPSRFTVAAMPPFYRPRALLG
jgi:hypothetical protein